MSVILDALGLVIYHYGRLVREIITTYRASRPRAPVATDRRAVDRERK